jgi:protein-disulfide isomerase
MSDNSENSPEKKRLIDKKTIITGATLLILGLAFWFTPPILLSSNETENSPDQEANNPSPTSSLSQSLSPENSPEKKKIVAVESYIDLSCEACKGFYKDSLSPVLKNYKNETDISFLYYPKYNAGLSFELAKFSFCASEQKSTAQVLDFFFFGKDTIETLESETWITELELDADQMNTCLQTAGENILEQKRKAQQKGVRGTPTTFVGEKKIEENVPKHIIELEIINQQK